jgi:transcriptional regulator with XRE-family HTH domain
MNFFEEATLRLKQQLQVTTDREVAEVMGMSSRAWAGRKASGAFPEKELYALIAKQPELAVDVGYVLTGNRQADLIAGIGGIGQRIRQLRGARAPELFAAAVGVPVEELMRIEQGRQLPSPPLVQRVIASEPHADPLWLTTGQAQLLRGELSYDEVVLVANYRSSSREGREGVARLAAFFASYNSGKSESLAGPQFNIGTGSESATMRG